MPFYGKIETLADAEIEIDSLAGNLKSLDWRLKRVEKMMDLYEKYSFVEKLGEAGFTKEEVEGIIRGPQS